jgi:protocatechuate 3,4-dioxygenase beta subunit
VRRRLSSAMFTAALLLAATVSAQSNIGAPQRPAAPARDTSAIPKKGTAVIRGRVVAADTGRPLRRARISLSSAELGPEGRRSASTNLDGAFELKDLPAARYTVSVARGGYLSLQYGQRRPGEQGRPLQLGDGAVLEKIDFTLPRMGTIAGRVLDETGEPIEGVRLFAMRMLYFEGRRKLVPVASSTGSTDDRGEYRINRLPPGTYTVMASTKETWTVTENGKDTVYGYVPTYFPGVAIGSAARPVTLKVGQEVTAIDFPLVPGRTAKITGQALDSQGRPFTRVSLGDEVKGLNFASFGPGADVTTAPDGTFAALNVTPGEYKLTAYRQSTDERGPEAAVMEINVDGTDLESVMLVGSSGGTLSGRIVIEDGSAPPKMSSIVVQAAEPFRGQPTPVLLGAFKDFGTTTPREDGTFSLAHVFGRARMQVTVPDGWMVKAITREGKDLTNSWLQLGSGEELAGVDVLVSNRVTMVEGRLLDERNQPLRDATVLVFPSDPDRWFENSKTIRATRPDQQGRWQAKGLPAGDYLAIALDYVEDGAWHDPEFLESLRRDAQKLTLADAGSETVALKVIVPKQ